MRELADAVLLSRSGLTRLVDRMEAAGLVCREAHASDRRGANAVLTAAGRAALRRAAPVHLRGIEAHFARHLSDAEVETLRAALGRVSGAQRGGRTGGPADPP
jgi:DNA-binding MarR family transcriptional regulator